MVEYETYIRVAKFDMRLAGYELRLNKLSYLD